MRISVKHNKWMGIVFSDSEQKRICFNFHTVPNFIDSCRKAASWQRMQFMFRSTITVWIAWSESLLSMHSKWFWMMLRLNETMINLAHNSAQKSSACSECRAEEFNWNRNTSWRIKANRAIYENGECEMPTHTRLNRKNRIQILDMAAHHYQRVTLNETQKQLFAERNL